MAKPRSTRRGGARGQKKEHVITQTKQLSAAASPVRVQILGVMEAVGDCSAADLAEHMDRPVQSLYYHLKKLESVGLIDQTGFRGEGVRREALYRPAAKSISVAANSSARGFDGALAKGAGATLRLANREYVAGLETKGVKRTGATRELGIRRRVARLTPDKAQKLNGMLDRVDDFLRKNATGEGNLYGVTTVLCPVTGADE
jgi:DNA-binding transcriptional ArsR family regulator